MVQIREPRHRTLPPKPGKEAQFIKVGKQPETIGEATAGEFGGSARSGFLKGGNLLHKPDYTVHEELSAAEKIQKKQLQLVLGAIIEPNALSTKSSPAMDRRSLVTKLGKMTLDELLRLAPDILQAMSNDELAELAKNPQSLDEETKADIQNRYLDVSP